jgi:hypothetical protein
MRRQLGKPDLLAVRSDKKECVVTHQDILSDSTNGPGLQKKDADASKYAQQGYHYFPCRIKEIAPSFLEISLIPRNRGVCVYGIVQTKLPRGILAFDTGPIGRIYAQADLGLLEVHGPIEPGIQRVACKLNLEPR